MTGGRWVSLAEAARITARSDRTIRRWVQQGFLSPVVGQVKRAQVLEVDRRMRQARRAGKAVNK